MSDTQSILCPRCKKEPDLPLYCRDCEKFYCSDCYQYHLIDFLPPFKVPQDIQDKVMKDFEELGIH